MRNMKVISVILILTILIFLIFSKRNEIKINEPINTIRSGTAIVMTGAAARIPQEAALLEELFNRGLLKNVVILKNGIIKRLEAFSKEAPELVPLSYVWIPDFQGNFLMFSFSNLKDQYDLTSQWAKNHDPIPLVDYLLKNK
jgi:hypothetical protein